MRKVGIKAKMMIVAIAVALVCALAFAFGGAVRAQGAGGILRLVEYGAPIDLAAVEFYGGHTVAGAVAAQIFLDRAVGHVDHPLQHFGIVLHPGTVDAGFAGHRGGAHNRILLFLLFSFFFLLTWRGGLFCSISEEPVGDAA